MKNGILGRSRIPFLSMKDCILISSIFYLSPFTNLIRRTGLCRPPHAPTDAEGYEQGNNKEDTHVYPPRDFCLYDILLQPWLHAGIADGEGHKRRYTLQGHVFYEEHVEDVLRGSTEHFAHGNFFSSLLAGEHNHGPYAEESDEDADTGDDTKKVAKVFL